MSEISVLHRETQLFGECLMIEVTRLNNVQLVLNCELIESVEEMPDTTVTMINGKKYIVRESIDEIVQQVIEFKRKCRM